MYRKSKIVYMTFDFSSFIFLDEKHPQKIENEMKHLHDPKVKRHFVRGERKDIDVF